MFDRFVVNSQVRARRTISAIAAGCEAADLAYTSYLRVVAIVGVVFIHIAGLTYIQDDLEGAPGWWLGAVLAINAAVVVVAFAVAWLLSRTPVLRRAV